MMQFVFTFSLIFLSSNAQAFYSPNYKTIIVNTPTEMGELRTEIHFAEKDILVAKRTEEIIRTDLTKAVIYFHHIPRDIVHINIDPFKRLTNGNATTFPTNIINLYNFPASNSEHLITLEDWLQGLLFHEFVHIVHLDQTRGYLEEGRNIFGTIAKVPAGITPRWFTEGIAVWAESHFLQGGRLQNKLLNNDLWIQLHKKDYCSYIDCLDEPGVYPHGQLAYWAGGHFMNYLENKKPNTIRCLVFENSGNVPFFLNDMFVRCADKKANELFTEFRVDFLANYNENQDEKNIENIFGEDDFQKGNLRTGDLLLKVEKQKKRSALVRYDLVDNINSYQLYSEPISHIGDAVKIDDETDGVLVAFNDDPKFVTNNKVWKIINIDTLLEEQTLNFSHDPSYVIPFQGQDYLTFSYEENHWRAYKNDTLIKEWPIKYNIVGVSKKLEQVELKINTANIGTKTYVADKDLQNIQENGQIADFKDSVNEALTDLASYPKWEHLLPHYWFLAFGNSNAPSSIGAMTTFSDPLSIHSLEVTALAYPSVKEIGWNAKYIHTDHLLQQYFLVSREFSSNSWSDILNKADDVLLGTGYTFELKKWTYLPQINLGLSSTADALSSQQNTYWNLLQTLQYQSMVSQDFWQGFTGSLEWGARSQSIGNPYYKFQSKINLLTNINDNFSIIFKAAYGKLYKNYFNEGVLYGGGTEQFQFSRRYEFYGLPYGDAYGNEIFTSRITHDLNVLDIYRGQEFIPIFLKEIHFVFGFESLRADRIYIDQQWEKNKMIKSFFLGTRLLTNLFYYVPTDLNIIYSSTKAPSGTQLSMFNIFVKLDF